MTKKKATYVAVPHARLWVAYVKLEDENAARRFITIECERWVDARHVARMLLGAPEVEVRQAPMMSKNLPNRYQVRWEGSAAGRVPDLRLRIRKARRNGNNEAWRDLR